MGNCCHVNTKTGETLFSLDETTNKYVCAACGKEINKLDITPEQMLEIVDRFEDVLDMIKINTATSNKKIIEIDQVPTATVISSLRELLTKKKE